MRKKKPFSLIEILVALVILASAATLVGLNIKKSIIQTQFQESVNDLGAKIKTARKLATLTQGGVGLVFERHDEGYITCRMTGESFPNATLKKTYGNKVRLSGVNNISFQTDEPVPYAWPIQLNFYPEGQSFSDRIKLEHPAKLDIESLMGTHSFIELTSLPSITIKHEGMDFYPHDLKNETP